MFIVGIAGSPNTRSRSTLLLNYASSWLEERNIKTYTVGIKDFLAEDLLHGRFDSPQVLELNRQLAKADGVILSTPVYKAAYAGALKTILDLLPERALAKKIVLPIATAGSSNHLLALDYALKPVIAALKAQEILQGVFAEDKQIIYPTETTDLQLAAELEQRLLDSLKQFLNALHAQLKPIDAHLLNDRLLKASYGI